MMGTYVFSTLALLSYNKICFGRMIIGLALRLGRGTRRLSLPRNLPQEPYGLAPLVPRAGWARG
jgi:hypothetical protein